MPVYTDHRTRLHARCNHRLYGHAVDVLSMPGQRCSSLFKKAWSADSRPFWCFKDS